MTCIVVFLVLKAPKKKMFKQSRWNEAQEKITYRGDAFFTKNTPTHAI